LETTAANPDATIHATANPHATIHATANPDAENAP
jgi:hypothetical protein